MNRPIIQVYAAAGVVFCEGFVLWTVLPNLNFMCERLGVAEAHVAGWVGVMFALQAAPRIVFNPLLGRLSDLFGRRRLMTIASLGTAASSVVLALAPDAAWLAASRVIAGAFGVQATLASATAAAALPPEKRSRGMALLGAAFGLSMILGPLAGGWLAAQHGHASIGWAGAAMQLLSALIAWVGVSGGRAAALHDAVVRRTVWHRPPIPALLAVTLLLTVAQSQATTSLPMHAKAAFDFDEQHVGRAFALLGGTAVLAQGAMHVLAARLGDRGIASLGLLLSGAGAVGLAAAPGPAWLVCALAVLGLGGGLAVPALASLLSNAVGPDEQGALQGVNQAAMSLGRGGGPLAAGALFSWLGPAGPYGLAAGLGALGAVIIAWTGTGGRVAQK